MKAKIFYITLALVLATGLAVSAVPGASVQAAEEDRDDFGIYVDENGTPYDYFYECTLVGGWITHDFPLIDYQIAPPADPDLIPEDPDYPIRTGNILIKIENPTSPWSGFDTYGQLAVDWIELYKGTQLLDRVDIGNPTDEVGHLIEDDPFYGWGPIEPVTSGGYYGGFGPPPDGTGEDCRTVWSSHYDPLDEDWATVYLDAGEEVADRLVIRVLDGMRGTPPSGGCFIATAAYGTESAEEIDVLRAFRDDVLLESTVGSQLVDMYYQTSPPVADFISENAVLRTLARELVVDPIASLVEVTEAIWGK